jgi:hypothetical protein
VIGAERDLHDGEVYVRIDRIGVVATDALPSLTILFRCFNAAATAILKELAQTDPAPEGGV